MNAGKILTRVLYMVSGAAIGVTLGIFMQSQVNVPLPAFPLLLGLIGLILAILGDWQEPK